MGPGLKQWEPKRYSEGLQQRTGDLLRPDDVTFAVLVRGYGEVVPPQWTAISGLLGMMDTRYQLKPSTGKATYLGSAISLAEATIFGFQSTDQPLPTDDLQFCGGAVSSVQVFVTIHTSCYQFYG